MKSIHVISEKPARFCFTYAMPEGAWLEFASGFKDWFSFDILRDNFGQHWIDAQLRKQGWTTGCWIACEETTTPRT